MMMAMLTESSGTTRAAMVEAPKNLLLQVTAIISDRRQTVKKSKAMLGLMRHLPTTGLIHGDHRAVLNGTTPAEAPSAAQNSGICSVRQFITTCPSDCTFDGLRTKLVKAFEGQYQPGYGWLFGPSLPFQILSA
jgi:hypothetical protein